MTQEKKLNNTEAKKPGDNWIKQLAESDQPLHLHLTNDFAFKIVFQNKTALKGLVGTFLSIPPEDIVDIDLTDSYLHGEYPNDHEGILDLKLYLNSGIKMNIEMQLEKFPCWEERSLFYLSKMFVENFAKGAKYERLEQCVHISILDFDLYENPPFYSTIVLKCEENNRIYSDKLRLHVLELTQLKNVDPEDQKTDIYRWAQMITADDWEVLRKMAQNNKYMEAAKEELEKINADKAKRYEYLIAEKKASDDASLRDYLEKEGMQKGMIKGEQKLAQLNNALIEANRIADLSKASNDTTYRQKLYEEFGI